MISMLQNWKGAVEINGTEYDDIKFVSLTPDDILDDIHIYLHSANINQSTDSPVQSEILDSSDGSKQLIITVKQYMTRKATPEFEFMAQWNNDTPMPLRTMVGSIEKETPGMYYMNLHGDIIGERVCTCMKCGKRLDNPVSQYFGMGPECGGHMYVNPFESDEELQNAVDNYRKQLQDIQWSGWIIKSAITSMEEMKDERNT